ncbi:hypothetical protein [Paenibacillus lutimineralis]|uniref:Uncharacterized protein n=1 Tax=Paenibacillus lutimineralis TaxID=2707005 RepID=A0A3Q9I7M1_9BACL|nr:hypothetical protein [Paenibacillus lutimineralis]AZS14577.1 hypothetical protein EI981_09010 [Paenibacillus lutimineralis]
MSLCVCFQNNDCLMIAADTAVVKQINGRMYRLIEPFRKLVRIGDLLVFMSGSLGVANITMERFRTAKNKTIQELQKVVIESCNYFSKMHPDIVNGLDPKTRDVAVLAAEYKDGAVQVHIVQPSDNFQIHTYKASPTETIPHTGGVYADEAQDLIRPMLDAGNKTAGEMIRHVFDNLSGVEIGGNLIVAKIDQNGISFGPDQPIPEHVRIPYYEDLLSSAFLTGSLIQTSASGNYPRAEMSSSDRMFKVGSSSSNSIEMRSLGYPNSIPDLYFKTGSSTASISLPSSSSGLYMSGDRLTAEFSEIRLRGYGSVSVLSWDQLKSEGSGRSLQGELDYTAYNMTFDPGTRNLKLWSRSGQLLAQVNIP